MIKKYIYMFFSSQKKKWKKTLIYKSSLFLWKQKKPKKYKKRKKNIFHKIFYKFSFLANFSSSMIILAIGTLWFITMILILFFSQYTSISKINIYREWSLIDINRAYSLLDYLRGSNLLTSDSKNIAQRLQRSQSAISEIEINKDFPNTINIYLDAFDIIFQTKTHFILANWSLIQKENEDFSDIQFLYLSEDISEYIDFQQQLSIQELESINVLIQEGKKNILGFIPEQIFYFIKERELIIRDTFWTLYIFDLEWNIENQIRRVAIYDTESIENNRNNFAYIDVRISEKLFLCSNESESICNENIEKIYWSLISQNPLPELSESQQ